MCGGRSVAIKEATGVEGGWCRGHGDAYGSGAGGGIFLHRARRGAWSELQRMYSMYVQEWVESIDRAIQPAAVEPGQSGEDSEPSKGTHHTMLMPVVLRKWYDTQRPPKCSVPTAIQHMENKTRLPREKTRRVAVAKEPHDGLVTPRTRSSAYVTNLPDNLEEYFVSVAPLS